jgi:hypothetical protein
VLAGDTAIRANDKNDHPSANPSSYVVGCQTAGFARSFQVTRRSVVATNCSTPPLGETDRHWRRKRKKAHAETGFKETGYMIEEIAENGARDGARTRDLRRDRPAL